jgi:DNA-binding LytR/AlgR family response regulator
LAEMITQVLSNLKNNANANYLHWIKAQHRDSVRLIPVEDVDYFRAEDKYTLVMTAEGETLIKKSIKELARELDPQQFWQIHRGTIVNVSRIENISRSLTGRGVVKLRKRPKSLTVSRNYLHLFKQM